MQKTLDTRTKLLTKSPFPLMIELAIPAVLGMVVVGLYNMMDSIFVGQMVGDVQMTGVFITAATVLSLLFYIPAELFPDKVLSMFITTPGVAASGATNFRIMFSTYILQGSFLIAVTLFQSLGKASKATWLVLFRQIILFIPLCVVLPMVGGMGIRGVWLAIALTDAILVVITIAMMLSEFRKMPTTSIVNR